MGTFAGIAQGIGRLGGGAYNAIEEQRNAQTRELERKHLAAQEQAAEGLRQNVHRQIATIKITDPEQAEALENAFDEAWARGDYQAAASVVPKAQRNQRIDQYLTLRVNNADSKDERNQIRDLRAHFGLDDPVNGDFMGAMKAINDYDQDSLHFGYEQALENLRETNKQKDLETEHGNKMEEIGKEYPGGKIKSQVLGGSGTTAPWGIFRDNQRLIPGMPGWTDEDQQTLDAATEAFNKGQTLKVDEQKQIAKYRAESSGGDLDSGAIDQAAERYAQTGTLPYMGMGASSVRQKIMNRAAKLYPTGSITANSAEYKANASSLANLQKLSDQVGAFENTAGKNLDQFLKQAQKVVDSGVPLANMPVRLVTGAMGGSDQATFNAARTVALTEISRVLNSPNASGVVSDSARKEVGGLITPSANLKQIVEAAKVLRADMKNRQQAYDEQIADIKKRLGPAPTGKPSVDDPLGILGP